MSPIELLYAKNTINQQGDVVQQELVFVLLVQNLAYEKCVQVMWTGEDGVRQTLRAQYVGPAGPAGEIWQASANFALTLEHSLPGDIRFLLHYRVAGRDVWNPPDQQGRSLNADSGIRLGDGLPLLNIDVQPRLHAGQKFYPITIGVRQDLHAESVFVRWTTNRWRTFVDTPAFFWRRHWHHAIGSHARNPNRYGCAVWISELHLGDAYQVEYALACQARGRQYWDANFGQNYLARHRRLRILTLNLHCYQEDRQDEKFSQIAQAIRDLQIDVVCLQEVGEPWNEGRGDWRANAAKLIGERLGEPFSLHTDWSHLGFGRYREGVAILSRYPFLARDARYVSSSQNAHDIHARKVVMGQIHVPYFGVINVFCVHLSWWENGFPEQFENLRRWADSKAAANVAATFLCGDFNNAVNTEGYRHLIRDYEDQFLKADPGRHNPSDDRRIDFVLMRSGGTFQVQSACRVFTEADYGRVSDHEGYWVEFEPPE